MTTGVGFRGINDTGPRHQKITYSDQLFDVGLRGEMGQFGDYFKTWNWELGFRYSRNEGQVLAVGEVSQPGLRDALLEQTQLQRLTRPQLQCPQHGCSEIQSLRHLA